MTASRSKTGVKHTCATCGYTLDHLPTNICPECGTAFDPTQPDIVRRNREKARGCLWAFLGGGSLGFALLFLVPILSSFHPARGPFVYFLLISTTLVSVLSLARAIRCGGAGTRLLAILISSLLAFPVYYIAEGVMWAFRAYWLP